MDASQSALDCLRTVEFRETLKGYHRDDVDEYLEKAAVEAEGLQEQLRQNTERLRKAAETIAQLETELAAKPEAPAQVVVAPAEPVVPDDTLQRTLLLAQKFVDETKADAEAEAARIVADAEAKVRKVEADSEQRLREEIARLESNRSHLSHEVETLARQLETERERLRTALAEMLVLVDGNLPASNGGESRPSGDTPPLPNISDSPRGSAVAGEVTQLRPSGASRPATSASTS
ncbi:MAG: DivIVA domain-containing protein [Acidimicrobiales bacterium]|jgi:DivIVA domain-containing protein